MFNTSIFYVGNGLLFDPSTLDGQVLATISITNDTYELDLAKLEAELTLLERPQGYGLCVASLRGTPIAERFLVRKESTSMQGKRHAEKADVSRYNIRRTKRSTLLQRMQSCSPIRPLFKGAVQGTQTKTSSGEIQVVTKRPEPPVYTEQGIRSIATARLISVRKHGY